MDRLLDVMAGASILLIVLVLISVRRAHIRVEYSVTWLIVALALLTLSRSRMVLDMAARHLGISYAPMVLLIIISCVFIIMFFRVSVIISRLRDNNIALAQRLAIVEYHVRCLTESKEKAAAAGNES